MSINGWWDGLVNVMTGLGTSKSKRSNNQWVYGLINAWQHLEAAYQDNWIAQRIVDIPAEDATREWRRIKSDGAEEIESVEQQLNVMNHVMEALCWSRLYGGAAILMVTDQDMERPLNPSRIGRGGLKKLVVFDRWDLSSDSINSWDILADNYLQPEYYRIRGGKQRIHHTHFARFHGRRLPRRWQEHTLGWGDSYLRSVIEDVADMVAAKGGIAELMQEANVDVIKRNGLTDDLASDQDNAIIKRYELFSTMKSSIQMALLDDSETMERQTLNLSGVAPIIEQFMVWISAASQIPVTKLFGTSAKGLNATGEGDERNYHQMIRTIQSCLLTEPMRTLDEVMVRSALGSFPASFDYEWNPLDTPNTLQVAQAQQLDAQRHSLYLAEGIVTRSQVMRELQAEETYQFDEDKIESLSESEDMTTLENTPDDDDLAEKYNAMRDAGLARGEILSRL